jgi:hypothetical protein
MTDKLFIIPAHGFFDEKYAIEVKKGDPIYIDKNMNLSPTEVSKIPVGSIADFVYGSAFVENVIVSVDSKFVDKIKDKYKLSVRSFSRVERLKKVIGD